MSQHVNHHHYPFTANYFALSASPSEVVDGACCCPLFAVQAPGTRKTCANQGIRISTGSITYNQATLFYLNLILQTPSCARHLRNLTRSLHGFITSSPQEPTLHLKTADALQRHIAQPWTILEKTRNGYVCPVLRGRHRRSSLMSFCLFLGQQVSLESVDCPRAKPRDRSREPFHFDSSSCSFSFTTDFKSFI